jgi:hypothetical protein
VNNTAASLSLLATDDGVPRSTPLAAAERERQRVRDERAQLLMRRLADPTPGDYDDDDENDDDKGGVGVQRAKTRTGDATSRYAALLVKTAPSSSSSSSSPSSSLSLSSSSLSSASTIEVDMSESAVGATLSDRLAALTGKIEAKERRKRGGGGAAKASGVVVQASATAASSASTPTPPPHDANDSHANTSSAADAGDNIDADSFNNNDDNTNNIDEGDGGGVETAEWLEQGTHELDALIEADAEHNTTIQELATVLQRAQERRRDRKAYVPRAQRIAASKDASAAAVEQRKLDGDGRFAAERAANVRRSERKTRLRALRKGGGDGGVAFGTNTAAHALDETTYDKEDGCDDASVDRDQGSTTTIIGEAPDYDAGYMDISAAAVNR